ncbi:unnamed protein product [Protopolystoma xenopodis]|uniref:Uncharacterized protein n=1 Tax=Protopolystoma xenopodis TaxID=117903 RepID=A0A448WF62_9PLAT|nr:unnamed protein product [Protopolystoma xenopodis]
MLQKLFKHSSSTPTLITSPATFETLCRLLAYREVEANAINKILSIVNLNQLKLCVSSLAAGPVAGNQASSLSTSVCTDATTSSAEITSGYVKAANSGEDPVSSSSVGSIVRAWPAQLPSLVEVIGHRLADCLMPEVRLHCLVGLSRIWRLRDHLQSHSAGGQTTWMGKTSLTETDSSTMTAEIPLQLVYW